MGFTFSDKLIRNNQIVFIYEECALSGVCRIAGQIREDIGKVFGETFFGTVGLEEVQTYKGLAQMAPFSPLIAALFSVFLLCWQQSATNVESTVMECFIKTIDSGLVRSQLLVEELGQRWFLQSG
ncbi:MAG: hypothetical protein IJL90_02355, partial [Lachnospiraceae bacterium]|nr:hypothetical protein [Lachnospiraceae bacterium]